MFFLPKKSSLWFALLVLVACNVRQQEPTEVQDSVAVPQEEQEQATSYSSEPVSSVTKNFTDYYESSLTEDSLESRVMEPLLKLLQDYDARQLFSIKSTYAYETREEIEPNEFVDQTKSVTVTAFYDSAYVLQALQREEDLRVGQSGFATQLTIYIFSNEELVGYYEDREESIQMAYKRSSRAVASLCPNCGIYLSSGVSGSEFTVSGNISEQQLTQFLNSGLADEKELTEYIALPAQRQGDVYTSQSEAALNEVDNYVVDYTIHAYLYEKFLKPKDR